MGYDNFFKALKQKVLIGILDNEPIILKKIKLGNIVNLKLSEIEDYSK